MCDNAVLYNLPSAIINKSKFFLYIICMVIHTISMLYHGTIDVSVASCVLDGWMGHTFENVVK